MTIYAHHQLPIKDVSESEGQGQGQGKGLGKTLYNKLLPNLAEFGIRRLYAVIALPNNISMGLHQQPGFKQVAILDEVGSKFEKIISGHVRKKTLVSPLLLWVIGTYKKASASSTSTGFFSITTCYEADLDKQSAYQNALLMRLSFINFNP